MKERVLSEIARIEREHAVRVLLTVESGSRAWGFASPDSDYDVRFIYVHRPEWYVSVTEARDLIEQMLPGDLDVSGWDLRKALRLFARCNLALNEWLGSPVIYAEVAGFREQLLRVLPQFFNPIAGLHHYRSMSTRAFEEDYADGQIGIKKLFYVLRPLLACRWIQRFHSQPPTAFADLVAADFVTAGERAWIQMLLARKTNAREAERIALDSERATHIRAELEAYKQPAETLVPRHAKTADLDVILRAWITS